ncbi:MAG TPA: ABC transporter ATP-binding protein [Xanthobacteraceae bacterium]|jgi:branched-chain amino acid transport system ATP-binding protein|nr:ABC transporter ATP-binding protein [Xanthobacteraceae bacterium]
MSPPLLDVAGLDAGYGDAVVLQGVAMQVVENTITAVIGSNGAGKTTLMRVLSGLLPARNGAVTFAGMDLLGTSAAERVSRGLALVPEGRLIFPDFTVQETLRIGAYCDRAYQGWRDRMAEVFDLFPRLKERRNQRAGSLSGGEQQMLALGRGLMSAPRLLLLDEPSLGLAPIMADWVFESVRQMRDTGVTICLVEQDVHAALSIADHAYVMEHGEIVKEGSAGALLNDSGIRENILGL